MTFTEFTDHPLTLVVVGVPLLLGGLIDGFAWAAAIGGFLTGVAGERGLGVRIHDR